MNQITAFFKSKGVGFYLHLASIVLAIFGLISYCVAGQDSYGLDATVIIVLAIGIVVALVFAYKDFFGAGAIVTNAFYGATIGIFLITRFMYYSYIYYGVGSDKSLSGAMLFVTIGFLGMFVLEIVSAFFEFEKGGNK